MIMMIIQLLSRYQQFVNRLSTGFQQVIHRVIHSLSTGLSTVFPHIKRRGGYLGCDSYFLPHKNPQTENAILGSLSSEHILIAIIILYANPCFAQMYRYQGKDYYSAEEFCAGEGFECNGSNADPKFTDRANNDFTLRDISPARTGAEYPVRWELDGAWVIIKDSDTRLHPDSVFPDNVKLMKDTTSVGAYGYVDNSTPPAPTNPCACDCP